MQGLYQVENISFHLYMNLYELNSCKEDPKNTNPKGSNIRRRLKLEALHIVTEREAIQK